MYKNYLIITENLTSWHSTEEEFLKYMKEIEMHNNDKIIKDNDCKIKVLFAGKVNVEMVFDSDRNKLVNV